MATVTTTNRLLRSANELMRSMREEITGKHVGEDRVSAWRKSQRESGWQYLRVLQLNLSTFTTRSRLQIEFHEMMTQACLKVIFGTEEFRRAEPNIREHFELPSGRLRQEVLFCCPRRFGKTHAVSQFSAAIIASVPKVKIVVFSPSARQSELLLETVKLYLAELKSAPDIVHSNRERIALANGAVVDALPAREESTRGQGGDVVICEEIAAMSQKFFNKVVAPLMVMEKTALICISTVQGPENFYTRLLDLRDEDGNPLFWQYVFNLICDACKAANAPMCTHRLHEIPPWQSSEKHKRIQAMMLDDARTVEQELMGVSRIADEQAFADHLVNRIVTAARWVGLMHNGPIFMAVDPNAGGRGSDCAAVCGFCVQGGGVILTHMRAFQAKQPEDYLDGLVQMVQETRRMKPLGQRNECVLCVENNLLYQAQSISRHLLTYVPNMKILKKDGKTDVSMLSTSVGMRTTSETKERMYALTRELLIRGGVQLHVDCKGDVELLMKQLKNYMICKKIPEDHTFRKIQLTFSGKSQGPDDLAIALQLLILWSTYYLYHQIR